MKKPVKKVLYGHEEQKYYWSEGDVHLQSGVIKEKELKDGKVKTHLGKEFICMPANFIDRSERIERGPATIHQKDIGIILANIPLDAKQRFLMLALVVDCWLLSLHALVRTSRVMIIMRSIWKSQRGICSC